MKRLRGFNSARTSRDIRDADGLRHGLNADLLKVSLSQFL